MPHGAANTIALAHHRAADVTSLKTFKTKPVLHSRRVTFLYHRMAAKSDTDTKGRKVAEANFSHCCHLGQFGAYTSSFFLEFNEIILLGGLAEPELWAFHSSLLLCSSYHLWEFHPGLHFAAGKESPG